MKTTPKMEMCHNIGSLYITRIFFLMTSHLNSQGTTDIKPEMLSGVQTGNGTPHDKYNIHGIAHVRTNIYTAYEHRPLQNMHTQVAT